MKRTLLILINLIGFLYQTKVLLDDYLRGETQVTIIIGPQDDIIPGLSFCTFDYYRFTALYKSQNYHRTASEYSFNMSKYNLSQEVWEEKFLEFTKNYVENLNVSEKFALDILNDQAVFINGPISMQIIMTGYIKDNKTGASILKNIFLGPESMNLNVDSMNFNGSPRIKTAKCFTFFSWVFEKWKNLKFKISKIEFYIVPIEGYWYLNSKMFKEIYFSIHSPNTIPYLNFENFIKVNADDYTMFHYFMINTELLGNGFDTDCNDYVDDAYISKNQCILECLKNFMLNNCITENFPPTEFLLSQFWLKNNSKMKIVNGNICLNEALIKYEDTCSNHCHDHCNFKYYQYDWNVRWKRDPQVIRPKFSKKELEDGAVLKWPPIIELSHSHVQDIYLKHIPQMNSISFICNFGGLLGMWLGLSFLNIFNDLMEISLNVSKSWITLLNKCNLVITRQNLRVKSRLFKFRKKKKLTVPGPNTRKISVVSLQDV